MANVERNKRTVQQNEIDSKKSPVEEITKEGDQRAKIVTR